MPRKWFILFMAALAPVLSLIPAGCVPPGDVGVALLVRPDSLNFGKSKTQLSFEVSKIFSRNQLQPVVATPTAPWVVVEDCNDAGDNCLSIGPNFDKTVRVSVLRDRMNFGTNRAQVVLTSGGASIRTVDIVAEDDIQAAFSADRRQSEAGQPVQFTDLSLASDDITFREWDFGDGAKSNAINPVHAYTRNGVYNVALTIRTANAQETYTATSYITVRTAEAGVDFTADRTTIAVNEVVFFFDLTVSPSAPVTGYFWDFGDGGTSTEVNPNHQYRTAGPKTVSLTVTTAQGNQTKTKTNYILVKSKLGPTAKIAISQLKPYIDVPVQFNDVSEPGTSPIESRVWEFGDGGSSIEVNPFYTYRAIETVTVKLTVITQDGYSSVEMPVEVVYKPPVAEFTVDDEDNDTSTAATNPDVLQYVRFLDQSENGSGPVTSWAWNFGDGKTSTEKNPRHRYTQAGTYSVSLAVRTDTPGNNTSSITKKDFMIVVAPPVLGFNFAPRSAFIDDTIKFTNTTTPGSETILSYAWDFDGIEETETDVSALKDPEYVFRAAGNYNTTLTVTTASRVRTFSQRVIVDKAPAAEFAVSPATATTVDTINFTDTTIPGTDGATAKAIVGRLWNFGDGGTSTSTNPTHRYVAPGTYTVKLTVTYAHSGTGATFTTVEEKKDFITITNPTPPTAQFTAPISCLFTGSPVFFSDASVAGTRPITSWAWRFGDGQTSTDQSPTHTYAAAGEYTVTLTVTSGALPAGFNTDTFSQDIFITDVQDLDDFVNTPDPAYQYSLINSFPLTFGSQSIATAYNLYMVSQTWRTAAEIYTGNYDGRVWNHNVTIIQPNNLDATTNTGLLLISGGDRNDSAPSSSDLQDASLGLIAALTGSTLTIVSNVPSQPIQFADEVVNGVANDRSEDAILAYSFRKYLDSFNGTGGANPDRTWPVLFPMTKAAVRTMDTVQDFLGNRGISVDDFIVLGGSKRGWTTWLTGITDCRVRGMIPIVADLLNTDVTVSRQIDVYGDFAETLTDYVSLGIFDRFVPGPGGQPPADGLSLLSLIDPYEYRLRARIPKLLINSTGDQFFLPDSSQFYVGGLRGETRLSYLPNTSHYLTEQAPDLTDNGNIAAVITSWSLSVIQDVERPTIDWTFVDANTIDVKLQAPLPVGTEVSLWQAVNPSGRDFRIDRIGEFFTVTRLVGDTEGNFRAAVNTPTVGYRAYLVQVKIPSSAVPAVSVPGAPDPYFVFSTPVRVVPDTLPF